MVPTAIDRNDTFRHPFPENPRTHLMNTSDNCAASPSLATLISIWLRVGLLSFGGPAGQIALMHRVVVEENRWLTEQEYLDGLGFCMLLPGPEAMQIASYVGWRLRGVPGGLIAGLLFIIPGALIIMLLASLYVSYGQTDWLSGVFLGIKAAVIVIVTQALLRIAQKALSSRALWTIALAAFLAIYFVNVPFPIIVTAAALFGYLTNNTGTENIHEHKYVPASIKWTQTAQTALFWLLLWALPFVPLLALQQHLLVELGVFFSKLAVVSFGGAYAVLAYLAQDMVNQFGWLTTAEMVDALGLAETTPGPLILVTEFAGFVAGFKYGGYGLAIAAALLTLWVTFVPCFLWIFCGAPYIEWISSQPKLKSALSAITAAVVGVIANLSLWFALHVLFSRVETSRFGIVSVWIPDPGSFDWRVLLLAFLSCMLLLALNWSVVRVLLGSAFIGWMISALNIE